MATEEEPQLKLKLTEAAPASKKEKKKPDNLVIPPPKPKLSKAERRALQEQQRAAKASKQQGGGSGGGGGGTGAGTGGSKAQAPTTASTAAAPPALHQQRSGAGAPDTVMQPEKQQQAQPSSSKQQQQQQASLVGGDASGGTFPLPLSSSTNQQRYSSISIVSHLTPYRDVHSSKLFSTGATLSSNSSSIINTSHLHPAVIKLGWEYETGAIRGGNARCRAMLECFAQVLNDCQIPTTTSSSGATIDPRQALDQQILKPSFAFLVACRPHSVTMGNAFTFLKAAVASLDRELEYHEMCATLIETIQAYQQERIDLAGQVIAELVLQHNTRNKNQNDSSRKSSYSEQKSLLSEKDVVLVYGHSEVVHLILQQATVSRIIVVDSRPLLEGREMLDKLLLSTSKKTTTECTYIFLNALTYVLKDVTKVLLGASALMSDGSVLGRAGMASVALLAHAHHIPVLVCAETYKISNRGVQLESITCNELGDPKDLPSAGNNNNNNNNNLKRLHLMYDLTPASFVTGIVTELGIVPPTSVAVLLREMNPHDVKSQ